MQQSGQFEVVDSIKGLCTLLGIQFYRQPAEHDRRRQAAIIAERSRTKLMGHGLLPGWEANQSNGQSFADEA